MRDRRSKIFFVASITFLAVALAAVQFFVDPYELRARLMSAIFVGSGIPLVGLLVIECANIHLKQIFRTENLFVIGLTICGTALTIAQAWWLYWREIGKPDWMRDYNALWLGLTIIGGTFIYASWETIDGQVKSKSYFKWLGITGAGVAAILVSLVLLKGV